jgi:hypothetical protein
MTNTTTTRLDKLQERLANYRAETSEAQPAFDRAVAALLSVGSDVTNNLTLLAEEVSEGVLDTTLDNIEHLAHLADRAREAKERLADAVFCEAAAQDEVHQAARDELARSIQALR